MPWVEKDIVRLREEFVAEILSEETSISALCRQYGITRPTAYKWLGRYERQEGFSDRSRAPKTRGGKVLKKSKD